MLLGLSWIGWGPDKEKPPKWNPGGGLGELGAD
jgi:hypothetical protein